MDLGDVGDMRRQLPAGEGADISAVQRDGTGVALQTAQEAAEQGAFPRAVGSQHGEEVAAVGGEGNVPQDGVALAVGKGQVFHGELHGRSPPRTIR